MAYHVAHALGFRTLILQKNRHIGERFFHVFDMDDFGVYETSRVIAEQEPFSIERRFEKELTTWRNSLPGGVFASEFGIGPSIASVRTSASGARPRNPGFATGAKVPSVTSTAS